MSLLLSRRRKELGLSQSDLGEKLFARLKRKSMTYAQKKISLFEAGQSSPTQEEIAALSEILQISVDALAASFDSSNMRSASEIFEQLAESTVPSLMAVCFRSKPGAPSHPDLLDSLIAALRKGLCYALVIPYPQQIETGTDRLRMRLRKNHYEAITLSVLQYRDMLRKLLSRSGMSSQDCEGKVIAYVPRGDVGSFRIDPTPHRETLIVEASGGMVDEHRLYSWVELAEEGGLKEVDNALVPTLVGLWELYYWEIITGWAKAEPRRLPVTFSKESFWEVCELPTE